MIRALLFDLDETLTVHESAYREAYGEMGALAEREAGVDGARLTARAPSVVEQVWQETDGADFTNRAGFGGRDVLWAGPGDESEDLRSLKPTVSKFRTAAWETLLEEQGVENDSLAQAMKARFAEAMWSRIRAFPEVVAELESVCSRYDMVLVTNGMPSVQAEKVHRSGLDRFFSKMVVSGAVGEGKPSPQMFSAALEMSGAEPHEAVMFGDVPERDILGAQRLGIHTVWVNRAREELAYGAPVPEREISDLAGLAELVSGL